VADYFVNSTETKLSHDLSEFLSSIVEEVDDMLRAAFELLSEVRIWCSDAEKAYVNVAIIGDEVVTELEYTTVDLNCRYSPAGTSVTVKGRLS
jgi:hypothetical protein